MRKHINRVGMHLVLALLIGVIFFSCGGYENTDTAPPEPPVANAGPDAQVVGGNTVTLDGSGSSDTDGFITSYSWMQTGGTPVTLSDPNAEKPQFSAPQADPRNGTLSFLLTVEDNDGLSGNDSVDVTVSNDLFVDDFSTDTTGDYTVTNTSGGSGQFLYDGPGERARVLTGTATALQFSRSLPVSSNSTFHVIFSPIQKYQLTGLITIRLREDGNNYYEVTNRDGFSFGTVTKYVNGLAVETKQFQNGYSQNNTYMIVISFSPAKTVVDAFGEVISLTADSSDILVGSFEIETEQQDAYYDDITLTKEPFVGISQPASPFTVWGDPDTADIVVQAAANNLPAGWGIRFVLDEGTVDEQAIDDMNEPFTRTYSAVSVGFHTIDAYVIDDGRTEFAGTVSHDRVDNVGIGHYYVAVGDSITVGEKDDIPSDNVSLDGRNSGGGFEPVLNDLLTASLNYPHTVENEGISGGNTPDGISQLPSIIASHPDSQFFLLLFGTNDAHGSNPRSVTSFKNNMQQMINIIQAAGKTALLAKVPVRKADCDGCTPYNPPGSGAVNSLIRDYNNAIDQLVFENGISVPPPDFYQHFLVNINTEFADDSHPNGLGYQSMADLWENAITGAP